MQITGNALVVGGGSGIGRACAVLLAREGASAVMVADLMVDTARDAAEECESAATNAQFNGFSFQVDITSEESVVALFAEASSKMGRIDYCVNCAGIGAQEATDIAGLSLSEFQRFLNVNTTGLFLVTREASIAMRAQKPVSVLPSDVKPDRGTTRGAIVNLGSATSMVATAGVLAYTTSKHAALGLTKNSALDNAAYGIRVNCVCPSWVDTPMVRKAIDGVEGLGDLIKGAVPMGRIAFPEEVADTVVYLCSPRSSYITGCGLIVDGGTTLGANR
ncbi:3-alpha-(Or 20-beta)-hydroxysteroid dehydrogenase [Colletotrichum higginsianum]|nr:3-alpha-(Or 20-beta)-hydroxysteroid dehydrogenase [Colletotrichum higginsianum]